MKNLSVLLLVIVLSSCKKTYNCSCGTTYKYSGGQDYFVSKTSAYDKKMTKKQATAVCENEAKNVNATYQNLITNNGTWNANGQSVTTNCTLR